MDEKIKISVILPVHNGEKYVYEAVQSILNQSFKDFELLVINDASTDNTLSIIESFSDSRLKLINIDKQTSLADVLNIGISQSICKYIARMDADDISEPSRLLLQYEFMEQNPDVVVSGGNITLIDAKGVIIGNRKYKLKDSDLRKNIFIFSPFAHPATIIRKEALLKVNGYTKGLSKVEDIDLWFRISKEGMFANINEYILKYRVLNTSQSLSNVRDHFKLTYNLRKKIINEGIYKIDLRQYILLEIQNIIVNISKILPDTWFMKLFEIGRKILN